MTKFIYITYLCYLYSIKNKNGKQRIVVELRKLQHVGQASFSVTLPPNWIKENKLKPSDQITITQEEDGSLRLLPGIPERKEFKITINADRCKEPGLLRRLIVGGYIRGCDLVEVVSKRRIRQDHKDEIQDAVDGLLGLGTMELASDHITIQSLIDHSKFPIKPLLKRLCELASSMHEGAVQALKDRDASLAADIIHRENEANKIYWLAIRQLEAANHDKSLLKKVGLEGVRDPAYYRTVAIGVERTADYAEDIAKNLLALGKKEIGDADLQKVIQLGKLAHEATSNAHEAFFNGDIVLANSTMEAVDQFEKKKEELIKEVCSRIKDAHVGMCLMTIIRDIRMIAECGKIIAEITIDNSITEKGSIP